MEEQMSVTHSFRTKLLRGVWAVGLSALFALAITGTAFAQQPVSAPLTILAEAGKNC